MSSNNEPSQWQQRATKFREHLSYISTTSTKKESLPHLKSHWSPSTTIVHSANSSPTIASASPPPPLPIMPEKSIPEPIKLTTWNNRSHITLVDDHDVDLERNTTRSGAGPSRVGYYDEHDGAGPSVTRPSRFGRFSFWRNHHANTNMNTNNRDDGASMPPETPGTFSCPNALMQWVLIVYLLRSVLGVFIHSEQTGHLASSQHPQANTATHSFANFQPLPNDDNEQ